MDLGNAALHFLTMHVPKMRHVGCDVLLTMLPAKVMAPKWMYNHPGGWVPVLTQNQHHHISKAHHKGGALSLEMHTHTHRLPHSDEILTHVGQWLGLVVKK